MSEEKNIDRLVEFLIEKTRHNELDWQLSVSPQKPYRRFRVTYKGFVISLHAGAHWPTLRLSRHLDEQCVYTGEKIQRLWEWIERKHTEIGQRWTSEEQHVSKITGSKLLDQCVELLCPDTTMHFVILAEYRYPDFNRNEAIMFPAETDEEALRYAENHADDTDSGAYLYKWSLIKIMAKDFNEDFIGQFFRNASLLVNFHKK